jgi:hypothetical protein
VAVASQVQKPKDHIHQPPRDEGGLQLAQWPPLPAIFRPFEEALSCC